MGKKYTSGGKITSLQDAISRIEKRKPFYFRGKFIAARFAEHWSVAQIFSAVVRGFLECAEPVEAKKGEKDESQCHRQ